MARQLFQGYAAVGAGGDFGFTYSGFIQATVPYEIDGLLPTRIVRYCFPIVWAI